MKIFAIIVTYNGMKWLERTLNSLRASLVSLTPIVVDNNSSDGSADFVKKKYPEAVVFQQDKNLGFGQANNVGFRYALENDADFVMLLNQDASIEKDALKFMLEANDGVSMISPVHLNGDGTKLDGSFENSMLQSGNGFVEDYNANHCKPIYKTKEVCAACWLMPISVIETIGGFNPLFFHYGEDNNYLQRIEYHKLEINVVSKAFICHDREELFGNKNAFYKKWVYRMMLIIAADINLTWRMRMKAYYRLLKDCYFARLSRGHYVFGMFFVAGIKILSQSGKISFSKQQERQKKANWL